MEITIREYQEKDIPKMTEIWNQVIDQGAAFPGMELLSQEDMRSYLERQTLAACACDGDSVVGMYVLHPNNIGRCAHIANASFAVDQSHKGRGVGEKLVRHALSSLSPCGFTGLQFNAVVASNIPAISLYLKLGFRAIGTIPNGFLMKDGTYQNIILFFHEA